MKWIKNISGDNEYELISGSDDNTCVYYNIQVENNLKKIALKGHTNGVTSIDGLWTKEGLIIITASADSTIRLWKIAPDFKFSSDDEIECYQKIDLNTGICFGVKLFELQDADVLLAFTTDDDKRAILRRSCCCNFH